jgi:hypothetical protein
VSEIFRGEQIGGKKHIFINFGSWKKKCFTIVLWDQPLKDYLDQRGRPEDLKGKWIRVNGLLTAYNQRPQISLTSLSEMMVVEEKSKCNDLAGAVGNKTSNQDGKRAIASTSRDRRGYVQTELPALEGDEGIVQGGILDRSEEVVQKIDLLYRNKNRKIRSKSVG